MKMKLGCLLFCLALSSFGCREHCTTCEITIQDFSQYPTDSFVTMYESYCGTKREVRTRKEDIEQEYFHKRKNGQYDYLSMNCVDED